MGVDVTVASPEGTIAFGGPVRGSDELGHDSFRVQLLNRPVLYGEWRPIFKENGNDFNVEVVSFGYGSESNLGNPHPQARNRFSAAEQQSIERLFRSLVANLPARHGISPFSSTKGRFLGGVSFAQGWILRED